MRYDRTVIAYHGCDSRVAANILAGKAFKQSQNAYDWLGAGIYFWEFGADRALRFAEAQHASGRIRKPAVVGAVIQLGQCFDLMDTRFTHELSVAFKMLRKMHQVTRTPLPKNRGKTWEKKARNLDCAVLNFYLTLLEKTTSTRYDTVRAAFLEGRPAFPGSAIRKENHIQIAVRSAHCIVGVFRPKLET